MKWVSSPEIKRRISFLITALDMKNIRRDNIYCFKSLGSSSLAIARIWSLPKIWQLALNIPPGYCIEVISEKFDRQSLPQQEKTLIHELLHIPKTFSGSLAPHRSGRYRTFRHYHDRVDQLFNLLTTKSYEI